MCLYLILWGKTLARWIILLLSYYYYLDTKCLPWMRAPRQEHTRELQDPSIGRQGRQGKARSNHSNITLGHVITTVPGFPVPSVKVPTRPQDSTTQIYNGSVHLHEAECGEVWHPSARAVRMLSRPPQPTATLDCSQLVVWLQATPNLQLLPTFLPTRVPLHVAHFTRLDSQAQKPQDVQPWLPHTQFKSSHQRLRHHANNYKRAAQGMACDHVAHFNLRERVRTPQRMCSTLHV